MNFLRNNWYNMGLILFVVLAFWMVFWGDNLSAIQKILMASLMALPIHQYEEYALPGGGPLVINLAVYGYTENYRHYPGNWHSCMIVNLVAYIFYIPALIFPQFIWLGIGTMFMNLMQLLGHGFRMNQVLKTWYNPGMATSVFILTPISIYYIWYIVTNNLVTGMDWLWGSITFIVIVIASIILPVQGMKDKNSPHDVPEWQVEQYNKFVNFAFIGKNKENKLILK